MPLTPDEATEMSSLESQISGYMSKDWLSPEQRASYDSIRSRLDDLQRRASTPAGGWSTYLAGAALSWWTPGRRTARPS